MSNVSLSYGIRDKTSFLRTFIDKEFPQLPSLSRDINRKLIRYLSINHPKHGNFYDYTLVGTALDYRIRYCFTSEAHLTDICQQAFVFISSVFPATDFFNKLYDHHGGGRHLVKKFNLDANILLSNLNPTKLRLALPDEVQLCRFCLLLARLDHARRSMDPAYFYEDMRTGNFDVSRHMAAAAPELVADLVALTEKVVEGQLVGVLKDLSVVHHGKCLQGCSVLNEGLGL